ncbi:MAG TPA: DUF3347 domain-containing protein [Ferruginibacter sp.]|nr:DUF3347 domain-containing protein [Ferruginibacter sp.]
MKKILLGILILVLVIAGYYWYMFSRGGHKDSGPKQAPIALKKHSDTFNLAVSTAMNAYFDMAAAFVDADTARVKQHDRNFIRLLDSIPMNELKKDTASIYDIAMNSLSSIKSNAESILTMTDILEMRKDFGMVSANLYPDFFKVINYEGDRMYWLNCPMAFGEDKEANWISRTPNVVNPYLGKNHPEFRATMLHCGMVKDTIKAQ